MINRTEKDNTILPRQQRSEIVRNYFPRLIGNDETRARLGRAIESGSLPHAFLIGGPSGSGKSTLAYEIAAALNCESRDGATLPCGVCNCCRRIYDHSFPDVKLLERKKDRATLGVEAVKDFREDMFLSATESESKIYIIDDAETMTPEAQNALLKVLEEPPEAVVIILLAKECDRILTTIKSRTQYIAMSRFQDSDIESWLLQSSQEARTLKSVDPDKFGGLIMSADGRLGLARELISGRRGEDNEEERSEIIRLISAIAQKASYAELHAVISRFPNKRAELQSTLERLISALRDLLIIKYYPDAKTVFFPTGEDAAKLCGDIDRRRIVRLYDAVSEAHELCIRNANLSNLLVSLTSRIKLISTN